MSEIVNKVVPSEIKPTGNSLKEMINLLIPILIGLWVYRPVQKWLHGQMEGQNGYPIDLGDKYSWVVGEYVLTIYDVMTILVFLVISTIGYKKNNAFVKYIGFGGLLGMATFELREFGGWFN